MIPQANQKKGQKIGFICLQIVIVLLAITVGFFGHRFLLQYQGEFGLLRQARDILMANSIQDLPDDAQLEYGMIKGMLAVIDDPYTYFVEPAAHEIQSDQLAGSFGGVGVLLERDTNGAWRVYPLPDSPAVKAGIENGDILLRVDDLPVGIETDETTLVAAIRGPEDDKVTLTLKRGAETLTFTLKRQAVRIPSVTWNLLPEAPEIGMVKIHIIANSTAGEIESAFTDLAAQGAEGFILDFQNNGGGLVDAGVAIARLFLSEGVILHQQFKDQPEAIFEGEADAPLQDVPIVILVNQNTASSAEIITGALQINDRALLVGVPTYGKTSIQYVFDLRDGSSIHVTSGKWWIPGQDFPLQPDILVTDDPTGVETLRQAIEALQAQMAK